METRLPHAVARNARPDRGDTTRQKLLRASIDVFGRHGFDGATTRTLADAAGVNLQAISYHFGGKDGLYVAAAEHIAAMIAGHRSEGHTSELQFLMRITNAVLCLTTTISN